MLLPAFCLGMTAGTLLTALPLLHPTLLFMQLLPYIQYLGAVKNCRDAGVFRTSVGGALQEGESRRLSVKELSTVAVLQSLQNCLLHLLSLS